MIRIAICDDNRKERERCTRFLTECAEKHKADIELACFESGESLLFDYIDTPHQVDIIYLDILMDQINGIDTARKLRDAGCQAQIVFLTSCGTEYLFDAFESTPAYYLMKEEMDFKKFEKAFLRTLELALEKKEEELFSFEINGIVEAIPIKDISHFEIWGRVITVYTNDRTVEFYGKMKELNDLLEDKNFNRVHRSYLINLSYIARLEGQDIILKTGVRVPIGENFVKSVKKTFIEYISRSHVKYSGGLKTQEERQ
ncbi:DNA-binding response regulator [Lacrimispora amygdalina]|uniref:Stage 0 sporulation protein A homolog n=1 Tax=Lacrimispora amygdalina TaxID=253257 RepID=A0A3E2N968_9FIRM|nr:LytTR family DNA-binding domain-containing protein [Clostridium indicum]RFZ77470.1 DNA-binding response regulator [Clostridium indicum]